MLAAPRLASSLSSSPLFEPELPGFELTESELPDFELSESELLSDQLAVVDSLDLESEQFVHVSPSLDSEIDSIRRTDCDTGRSPTVASGVAGGRKKKYRVKSVCII